MRRFWPIAATAILLTAGLAQAQSIPEDTKDYGPEDGSAGFVVRGTTDIALFEPIMAEFSRRFPAVRIEYEQWSSNDLYLASETDCRSGNPVADLVISSSIDQQVKLANDGCAQRYRSTGTAALPAVLNWRDEVFGITREPAVIVYNRANFSEASVPLSRFDLIDLLRPDDNRLFGRIATYDIESSGLGYLFAFADAQQATTFGSLIEAFGRSGAVADCCSASIIDGVATGKYLIAYNVLGSYALARADENPDIVVVAPDDYTLVLSRAALIPKGAAQTELAAELLEFLLSEDGRRVLRSAHLIVDTDERVHQALRLPENPAASLRPIALSPALLVGLDKHKRQQFIARWRGTFPSEAQ
ncbi:MAG: extracellular solute-binding protein [Pseudomonadota bacterium]